MRSFTIVMGIICLIELIVGENLVNDNPLEVWEVVLDLIVATAGVECIFSKART